MLKLKRGTDEYEILGQVTFQPDPELEDTQTNYTIVIDGVTTTVESTDTEWEVIEAPDPIVESEPEEEVVPPSIVVPLTQEEIERNAWLEKFQLLEKSLRAKQKLEAVGLAFTPEEQARFDALVTWVSANRKIEYVAYM
jgi:hypothetical protein